MSYKVFSSQDFLFKMPFAALASGPSKSGKSTFILRWIKHATQMIRPVPVQIVYAYSQYTKDVAKFESLGVITYNGLPDEEFLSKCKKPLLLILDDMMLYVTKQYLENLFTIKSHHDNIGVIFVVQNLFDKNIKTARDNAQYIILMNSPSAIRQIRDIGVQLYPHKLKGFMEAYESASRSNKFGYLLIDLHPTTDNDLRLRTNIFPGEYQQVFVL